MAWEKCALDERIALVADLFATRGFAGSVSFPDGLSVALTTVPLAPPLPASDERTHEQRLADERREHYSTLLGRPVSDAETKAYP